MWKLIWPENPLPTSLHLTSLHLILLPKAFAQQKKNELTMQEKH